jgi:hypothetical protein
MSHRRDSDATPGLETKAAGARPAARVGSWAVRIDSVARVSRRSTESLYRLLSRPAADEHGKRIRTDQSRSVETVDNDSLAVGQWLVLEAPR